MAAPVDYFVNPTGLFDRLVLFTDDAIVVANPEPTALAGLTTALQSASWQQLLAASSTVIPYAAVSKVSTNQYRDVVSIRYRDHARGRFANIGFKDTATRDRALANLRRRLGGEFEFSEVQYGRLRAAVGPLLTVIACLALTWLFHRVAIELAGGATADITGRQALGKNLAVGTLRALGPLGVLIVGSLAIIIGLAWGSSRMRQPPRMLTLARRS